MFTFDECMTESCLPHQFLNRVDDVPKQVVDMQKQFRLLSLSDHDAIMSSALSHR
jgi:hypothetical protein